MKRVIYKYELALKYKQDIELPMDYDVLSVQCQNNSIMLWAVVYPTAEKVPRRIYIFGTGEKLPDNFNEYIRPGYLGTVQQDIYVWHIFMPE